MTYNIYAKVLRDVGTCKPTENGANSFSTTKNGLVDLFATIGAMRNGDCSMERIAEKVDAAYAEDPLLTAKTLFYARDIRGGLGEREVFRKALYHCGMAHPDLLAKNLQLIPEYGRWDDMFSLIGTPLEEEMWKVVTSQLAKDTFNAANGDPEISLCAKWMPSADTSSKQTRELARYAAGKLGMSVYSYKRYIRYIRKHLRLLEQDMTAKRWGEIDYGRIPSQAHMRHVKAFHRNDEERYSAYLEDVKAGKAGVNTGTLFPYEIVERLSWDNDKLNEPYEEMWRHLPDYVGGGGNILVIADVSGSMHGRPMAVSTSLALYFAERNKGAFADMFMTFSNRPQVMIVDRSASVSSRYRAIYNAPWGGSTDLYAALGLTLQVAEEAKASQEDIPKALVIITDMEIDQCEGEGASIWNTVADKVKQDYENAGYVMPNLVFWNVASRHDTYLARCNFKGVQMVSGCSPSVFRAVLGFMQGMTPAEAMRQVLSDRRYDAIAV